ncbi:MAG: 6-phosphogluconolactonase [Candidatus Omnitrophota bacterium]|nr:6-phosphogluconolactonase [Candidatus Omnitrophota bacterium]
MVRVIETAKTTGTGKPTIIIARTTKGANLPGMEKHGAAPKEADVNAAMDIIEKDLLDLFYGRRFNLTRDAMYGVLNTYLNLVLNRIALSLKEKSKIDERNSEAAGARRAELLNIMLGEKTQSFVLETQKPYSYDKKVATRTANGDELLLLGAEDPDVVVMSADLRGSVMFDKFEKAFGTFSPANPRGRYIPIGIREAHMASLAAGLAACGKIPVIGTFSIFTTRMPDQLNAVLNTRLPIVIVGTHGGLATGPDGRTHQDAHSQSVLGSLPGVKLIEGADAEETRVLTRHIYDTAKKEGGIFYIRPARLDTPILSKPEGWQEGARKGFYTLFDSEAGKPAAAVKYDVVIVSTGVVAVDAVEAAKELATGGKKIRVVNVCQLTELANPKNVTEFAGLINCENLITVIDALPEILGDRVNRVLVAKKITPRFVNALGINKYGESGKPAELYALHGFDKNGILKAALNPVEFISVAGGKPFGVDVGSEAEGAKTLTPDEELVVARAAYRYISMSMGGDKLAVSIVDGNNNIIGEPAELRWQEDARFNNGQIRIKTPEKSAEVMDVIADIVAKILAKNSVNPSDIKMVNAGLAGPLDKTRGIFGSDFATPNLPFDKYPFRAELRKRLLPLGINVSKIEMVNDGEAARNGEHYSPKGKLVGKVGGIVIIGGGINISVDGDDSIKECGHNLYQVEGEKGGIHYAWGGIGSKGNHPIELGNTPEEIKKKCGVMGEEYVLLGDAAFRQKYPGYPFIYWKAGLRDFEDMLSGPNIRERVRKAVESNPDKAEYRELKVTAFNEGLVGEGKAGQYERALTIAALRGNSVAKGWIVKIGREVGLALAAFAAAYRNKPFAENLVLVSGVNENLGKGVDEVGGVDLYMRSVRESMYNELISYFYLDAYLAHRPAKGVVRSDLTYERELVSYRPTDEEVLTAWVEAKRDKMQNRINDLQDRLTAAQSTAPYLEYHKLRKWQIEWELQDLQSRLEQVNKRLEQLKAKPKATEPIPATGGKPFGVDKGPGAQGDNLSARQGLAKHITVNETEDEMGTAAAAAILRDIKKAVEDRGGAVMLFASAPSQHSTWKHLIDSWTRMPEDERRYLADRIIAFHMDEYLGLSEGASQLFGKVLRENLFNKLGISDENIHYFNDRLGYETALELRRAIDEVDAAKIQALAQKLESEAESHAAKIENKFKEFGGIFDIVIGGIGKLPHLAFNDPPEARFEDSKTIKVVRLTETSRQQQVDDGEFARLSDVPTHALTFTLPPILSGRRIHIMVPRAFKAEAVRQSLDMEIGEARPASGLRLAHVLPNVSIYLDRASAGLSDVARMAAKAEKKSPETETAGLAQSSELKAQSESKSAQKQEIKNLETEKRDIINKIDELNDKAMGAARNLGDSRPGLQINTEIGGYHSRLEQVNNRLRELRAKPEAPEPMPATGGKLFGADKGPGAEEEKSAASEPSAVSAVGGSADLFGGSPQSSAETLPAQPRTYDMPPLPVSDETAERSLIAIISEFVVPLGKDVGPGSIKLSRYETQNVWQIVNLLNDNQIEILLPQRVKLTETMRKALSDIRKRKGEGIVRCEEYADGDHLKKLLGQKMPSEVKRIILTEQNISSQIQQLVEAEPKLFSGIRLLNIALPDSYMFMNAKEKTFYQARMVMTAILARLYERDRTPMVELILTSMLRGCVNVDASGINGFLARLAESEDEAANINRIKERILYCLGRTVSIMMKLAEDIERVRLMMKEFWTAV